MKSAADPTLACARLGLARVASALAPAAAVRIGPLEYTTVEPPELPGPGWHRVRPRLSGICGSDLSMIEGHASTYFDDWVSFPFVPGHEVVGELDDGRRVVLEPVLGHEARGFPPPFDGAAPGDGDDYAHLATGTLEPGIQTGFCCSTGGGWSPEFVAHDSQLHPIGDDVPDERAVLIEPLAAGIHAALDGRGDAVGRHGRRPARRRPRRRHDGARRDRRPPPVLPGGAGRRRRPLPAPAARSPPVGRRRGRAGGRALPRRAPPRRLSRDRRPALLRSPRDDRRRRHRDVDRRRPAHHPAAWPGRADGDAGRGHPRPHRSLAPGDRARRRLHVRDRDLPDGRAACAPSPSPSRLADAIEAERWLSATYPLADHVDAIAHAAAAGRRGAIKVAFEPQARSR